MEKFDKLNPYNPNAKKTYSKKTLILVALFTSIFFIILINFAGGSSSTIGKYTKEELPKNFSYAITKDDSTVKLDKNQLYVELSEKLTVGQIATLAEELFNSKDKQRRFYIFYKLKGENDSVACWAISHFDPELEIEIIGSTNNQDSNMLKEAKKVNGNVLGVFNEKEYTFAIYTVYEKDNSAFVKTTFKNGQVIESKMRVSKTKDGNRYDYNTDESNGEYYILTNENVLEFYNKENKRFTSANQI
jgi:hypothetical protein